MSQYFTAIKEKCFLYSMSQYFTGIKLKMLPLQHVTILHKYQTKNASFAAMLQYFTGIN